jgi:hypothetical protein
MRQKTVKIEYFFIAPLIGLAASAWADSWAPMVSALAVLLLLWDEERAVEKIERENVRHAIASRGPYSLPPDA